MLTVADFPDDAINRRPPNVDYTPWHLVEHLRLTQVDILEYIRDPKWVSPDLAGRLLAGSVGGGHPGPVRCQRCAVPG